MPTGALVFPPVAGEACVLVDEVLDGDTVRVCWLVAETVRLYGVNAPEVHGPEKERGLKAKLRLAQLLPPGTLARATLRGREKYGRLLAELSGRDGPAARVLLAEGLVAPWDGRGARPLPDLTHPLLGID